MYDHLASDPRVTVWTRGLPDPDGRCVVYWMQRAQRATDNPALDVAVDLANELRVPVVVFLGLHPGITRANLRHYQFLVEGLPDIEDGLRLRGVGFVLRPFPHHSLHRFVTQVRAAVVIGDENPLRQFTAWRARVAESIRVPFWTVDADVVVPSRLLLKEQYAARTIRPRIHARLNEFLVPTRDPSARVPWQPPEGLAHAPVSPSVLDDLPLDRSLGPVTTFIGGTTHARQRLEAFVRSRAADYDEGRNHPERAATSELSPYLHFGHIGPREVALAVQSAEMPADSRAAFIEQLVVRRELAVNFVTYNPRYDTLAGCEPWARATLARHTTDPRPAHYREEVLDAGDTGDPLWNAAQHQMAETGWMHGYVRMYWAKKLLEWMPDPEQAHDLAVRLNDRYQLDGRDPNGYTNIAWAIGGKHDRPWPERPVFGTIRSMSLASTSRKFDAAAYIARWRGDRAPLVGAS